MVLYVRFFKLAVYSGGDIIDRSEASTTATLERNRRGFQFRKPVKEDGADVWKLIKGTGILDLNSSYSYLMWCEFFNDTSIVVEHDEHIVGFISGFIRPTSPETLFIWQVAVDDSQRGKGLGTSMLLHLIERSSREDVQYLEATVSPSNIPSQQLFKGLAEKMDTQCDVSDCFTTEDFPEDTHEDELIYRIGPFLD